VKIVKARRLINQCQAAYRGVIKCIRPENHDGSHVGMERSWRIRQTKTVTWK